MLLAVDIGNTNIVVGIFKGNKLVAQGRMAVEFSWLVDEYTAKLRNLLPWKLKKSKFEGAIISSVVPRLTGTVVEAVKSSFAIAPDVTTAQKIGLETKVDNVKEVGVDRLVNAFAARQLYGLPLIIVDFGTATTFDAVSSKGEYLGGAIVTGLGLSRDVLHEKTAKLPRIELARPPRVIGKNTVQAMQSGLFFGYVEMVEGMVKRFKKELGGNPKIIVTGGLASFICRGVKGFKPIINEDLTLKGLQMIYERG